MKTICVECKVLKDIEDFPLSNDWTAPHCKGCRARAANRKHYAANRQQYLDRNKRKREKLRKYVRALKEHAPCPDCKQKWPYYVMQFDHREDKRFNISEYVASCGSWRILKEEIAKCDIVCGNCHAIRTHNKGQPDANLLAVS